MSVTEEEIKKHNRTAQIQIWLATKSSRNKSISDKVCRFLMNKATAVKPEDDFMRDAEIDNDVGFDPDELDRYQRGAER